MNKFFWVCLPDGTITIAEVRDGSYDVPGNDCGYDPEELTIGSEILFQRTGLLAALNDVK